MRKQLLLLLFSVFAVMGYARVVHGVVTQKSDGETIIGASVQVKGTTRGAATDMDGKYSIEVNDGDVLVISYVGMNPVSIKVSGGQSVINVEMEDNTQVLQEVVVTAYGQTQEKKKLNFAVQTLSSDQVTAGSTTNFANALQGKVAGLQVSTGGGSPNSSTQVIIRAISSVNNSQSNEPLMIVDGVPIRGKGSTLADINSNDIENMTVLKGAAASALYGQEAANGVIMITTKSGSKDGSVKVNANATVEISNCMRVPQLQSSFTPGTKGFYKENVGAGGWGPYFQEGETRYDNLGDFLGTGVLQKYDINVSGGTEKFNAYASASYTRNEGVVPKDYKNQLTVFLKSEFKPSSQVTVTLSANFINNKSRGFGNSMSTIYNWGRNKNMSDYQTVEGYPNWQAYYDHYEELIDTQRITASISPYFGRYNDKSETESNRFIINGQISYEPIKSLVFTGKLGYDKGYSTYESYTVQRLRPSDFNDYEEVQSALADYQYKFGAYVFEPSRSEQFTAQFLATYQHTFAEDFNFNLLYGMEYKESSSYEAEMAGQHFVLDGDFYSFMNIDPNTYTNSGSSSYPMSLYHSKGNKYGYFGELRFDYKGLAQVSVTGRHDGSSTLKQAPQTSYFYPSVTGGVIFSELFNLTNDWFSYGKLRGNWAKVGKDAPRYVFTDTFKQWTTFPDGGFGIDPTVSKAVTLEPEMTSSWEIGADLRFFRSRTRLDLAYYSTTVDNQIVSVRVSPASGTILQTRNEGSIENYGVEATLAQDIIKSGDFSWTANLNFSFNRGRVVSLPEDVSYIQGTNYSGIYPVAQLGGSTTGIIGKDYLRNENGDVICDENGYPKINADKSLYIGNREPKCLIGLGSQFQWKNVGLSFLLDGRVGGDVVNLTGMSMIGNGTNHLYDKYRNREYIFKGVVDNGDGTYSPNTTPVILNSTFIGTYYSPVSSNFIEDGSYLRLSYVTLSYDFSSLLKAGCPVKGLSATLTGRNLFLLTKYTGCDPAIMAGVAGGTGAQGIDNFSVPTTRSFNLTLKASF